MIQAFVNKLFDNYNKKQIKLLEPKVEEVDQHYKVLSALSDEDLQLKFKDWKELFSENPEKIDEKLPEVFAGVKSAASRLCNNSFEINGEPTEWKMVHYDVQLIGGMVLHSGKISEMKTGEGKTLVCTLPVILNALTGKGVHVITVNDYLASRDAEWMRPLYEFCGVSVGIVTNDVSTDDRREAYNCDVTYGTNNEFGFDYLRDNMAQRKEDIVQRDLNFAIVDEVDSILIDEARTPLIISAAAEESTDKYQTYSQIIPRLKENEDYNIDYKQKSVHLTEGGIKRLEELLGISNFYTEAGFEEVHHIENALKANVIMIKDQDYVIRDDKVIIIDEFTGRMMAGRRYSDGLHQSLEAKESVEIQRESKTLATVTFQNYFRLYAKLAGMTGTAETEAEEFAKIYRLDTLVIPTNESIQRQDFPDKIFKNESGKIKSLITQIKELSRRGQPALIGTVNIDQSELLSSHLEKSGIIHEVLNAKHHEREAEIIAKAGQKGAITIATNMAGRGTDIKLGEGVKELGGLAIIGTERHESRRIDNQLRGRAGRQGDPGFSQFYVAMTDQLMRRFGGDKLGGLMERMGLPEDESIENNMISKSVENAQKKIEGFHFDARKHVVQYDDVMNIHREKIYTRRRKLLSSEKILDDIDQMLKDLVNQVIEMYAPTPEADHTWDAQEIFQIVTSIHQNPKDPLTLEELEAFQHRSEMIESVENYLLTSWDQKKEEFPEELVDEVSKQITLRSMDELWLDHIDQMTHLRDRVALSGYAQKDPVMEYKAESFRMFSKLLQDIRLGVVSNLFRIQFKQNPEFETADYSEAQTNADEINKSLEDTGEYDPNKLTRQQRRAIEREQKKK